MAYRDVVLADSPSVYYRLNDTDGPAVPDAGADGVNLAETGTVTFRQAGALTGDADKAVKFPGTGTSYLATADSPGAAYNLGNGPLSIEFWYKLTDTGTQQTVISKGNTAYMVRRDAGGHWILRKAGASNCFTTTGVFNDTTGWHHFVAARAGDGTAPVIYVDGVAQAGTFYAQTFANTTGAFTAGADSSHTTEDPYRGLLDELAIYKKALTAARVAAHYAAGSGGSGTAGAACGGGAAPAPAVTTALGTQATAPTAAGAGTALAAGPVLSSSAGPGAGAGTGAAAGAGGQPGRSATAGAPAGTGQATGAGATGEGRPAPGAAGGTGAASPASCEYWPAHGWAPGNGVALNPVVVVDWRLSATFSGGSLDGYDRIVHNAPAAIEVPGTQMMLLEQAPGVTAYAVIVEVYSQVYALGCRTGGGTLHYRLASAYPRWMSQGQDRSGYAAAATGTGQAPQPLIPAAVPVQVATGAATGKASAVGLASQILAGAPAGTVAVAGVSAEAGSRAAAATVAVAVAVPIAAVTGLTGIAAAAGAATGTGQAPGLAQGDRYSGTYRNVYGGPAA